MPSNKDLRKAIEAEAIEKGVEVPNIEGMNNMQLAATLSELKATEESAIDSGAIDDPEEEAETEALPPYTVSKGKAVCCKKGTIGEGAEMREEYLSGGSDDLARLIERGVVDDNT